MIFSNYAGATKAILSKLLEVGVCPLQYPCSPTVLQPKATSYSMKWEMTTNFNCAFQLYIISGHDIAERDP